MLKFTSRPTRAFNDFSAACRELAALTGNSVSKVIDHEVGAILSRAAAKTKIAPHAKVIGDHNKQMMTAQKISYGGPAAKTKNAKARALLAQRAGQRRGRSRDGYLLYALPAFSSKNGRDSHGQPHGAGPHRHPGWLWAEISARRTKSLQEKLARRGVAAKHWVEQARQLGLLGNFPSEAVNAKNKAPLKVWTKRSKAGETYFIEGKNYSKLCLKHAGGESALKRAVSSRITQFNNALKNFASGHINKVAKKYPELIAVS